MIALKRVYEKPASSDGYRILVDRLWPRGLAKRKARIDLWLKEIAPSTELRKWFSHEPEKWVGFKKRYYQELKKKTELIQEIKDLNLKYGHITLLYAAKDGKHNNAKALLGVLG